MPVPQVRDFEELNGFLRQRCEEDRQRRLRGQSGTKAQLLVEDQAGVPAVAHARRKVQERPWKKNSTDFLCPCWRKPWLMA